MYKSDSRVNSQFRAGLNRIEQSRIASKSWHSDITFENVPSDYAILKLHTNPTTGGDTLWASAYEAYSRLSKPVAKMLEGLEAVHDASWYKNNMDAHGMKFRDGVRGNPLNKGGDLVAVHPVIRVNPVTGWKGLLVNREFTTRIVGPTADESDVLLKYLFELVSNNHDLQVRFTWSVNNPPGVGDIAIWDNRSTFHTPTFDFQKKLRKGDRVVSLGEKPYYDPAGKDWREARGLPSWEDEL